MADSFQIVSARLLNSFVCIDRSVSCRACQVLAILVRDMLTLTVLEALSQPKVNNVDLIFGLVRATDQEIIWFDIPVDYSLFVHFLDAHQLNRTFIGKTDKF